MLHIITGEINSGKTALMKKIYLRNTGIADGILSEKFFINGDFWGYKLIHLQSGKKMDLAVHQNCFHEQFHEAVRLGSFVFSSEAFHYGAEYIRRLCEDFYIYSVFLDEIGPLELHGQGFDAILPKLLHSGKEVYITVRRNCLQKFLQKYNINHYHLISTHPAYENANNTSV